MSKFKNKVYEIVKKVPRGKVVSYGQVALLVGVPKAAIQVGWVLHQGAEENNVPWWRVINKIGQISTTCMEHTNVLQKQLLENEGIVVSDNLVVDMGKYRYLPSREELYKYELDDDYIGMILDKLYT